MIELDSKKLKKLMKEKLVKDGIDEKWIEEKMIFVNYGDEEEAADE